MTPFEKSRIELKASNIVLSSCGGEYRVNFLHGHARNDYVTDDLMDALHRGREMAEQPAPRVPDKPIGPLGSPARAKRKAKMYRHNNAVMAQRRKKQQDQIEAEITAKLRRKP